MRFSFVLTYCIPRDQSLASAPVAVPVAFLGWAGPYPGGGHREGSLGIVESRVSGWTLLSCVGGSDLDHRMSPWKRGVGFSGTRVLWGVSA